MPSGDADRSAMSDSTQRLRTMVIGVSPERACVVQRALQASGHDIVASLPASGDLLGRVAALQPDVIIVDVDSPDHRMLEFVRTIDRDYPRPIVMFSNDGESHSIEAAVHAGISAYVVDGLRAERVMPIVEVAMARFKELQALRRALAEARNALAERKTIERAKGILMKQRRLEEDAAYAAMRKLAMDRNLKMVELARSLIAASEILAPAGNVLGITGKPNCRNTLKEGELHA